MVQILAVPVFIVAVAAVWLMWLGPLSFSEGRPMDVAPHPHIGLQAVMWLLDGEVVHNDSLRSRVLPELGLDSPKARQG
jgi:redox-sensitive bicupin YhaK (pirin superfamily)